MALKTELDPPYIRSANSSIQPSEIGPTDKKLVAALMASPNPIARLANKVAIVTGGARGIGECIVRSFVEHGAKVVIADIRDDLGKSVCEDIGVGQVCFIHCDVAVESDIEHVVNATIAKYGKLDIMVNNAGITDEPKLSILDNDKSDFERVIGVNLTGVFLGTKHAARVMIPNCKGSIITIGSVASITGGGTSHAYTSSKHGVVGLAKNAAAELGKYQIRVNCISPYVIPTVIACQFFNIDDTSSVYSNLKGKTLEAKDVANATLFLASDESGYISGHNLVVDGGYSVLNPTFGLFSWPPK
ncbi:putative oxidoreductase [Helianthus annuus]|nr:putative oxidoreductase [Helianthus annuus]KAJ0506682.1 putative oxidoreductase [Helianthus annuus]KAJ0679572.1 putative oxidoreductase [Helianthus annuus]KAJ0868168.1 putative oxidoreductase [Helianthus annuus]